MFEGFSQSAIDFLWGLKFNNERSWFLDHKGEFLELVDGPMKELARQVYEVMDEEFPELQLQMKVSRIYRDARRLHGSGPYKDHLWFSLRKPGEKDSAIPCLYFELAPCLHLHLVNPYRNSTMHSRIMKVRLLHPLSIIHRLHLPKKL